MFAKKAIWNYLPLEYRKKEAELMFELVKSMMANEKDESNKRNLLTYFIVFSITQTRVLIDMLKEGIKIPGYGLLKVIVLWIVERSLLCLAANL